MYMGKGYCCDMRGMLSFLVLFFLSKKSMHGQEIAEEIGKRKGEKPSPGTIYPVLKALKENGLIKERKEGKAVYYEITPAGKAGFAEAKRHFCKTFMDIF